MSERVAGRLLDAEIAEKVMGWTHLRWSNNGVYLRGCSAETPSIAEWVPAYSTDIAAAWPVVEAMARFEPHPWMLTLQNWNYYGDRTVRAQFTTHALGPDPVEARAASAPEAICKAALLAVAAPAREEGAEPRDDTREGGEP